MGKLNSVHESGMISLSLGMMASWVLIEHKLYEINTTVITYETKKSIKSRSTNRSQSFLLFIGIPHTGDICSPMPRLSSINFK